MAHQEKNGEGAKLDVFDCHESEISIFDLYAVAKNWTWLREKADLFISTSQATRQVVHVTNADQKFRKCLRLKRGFKFPVTMEIYVEEAFAHGNAFGLDLNYVLIWDLTSNTEPKRQAVGTPMDERQLVLESIREAIVAVAEEMRETATGAKWKTRDTEEGYSSAGTLIQVCADDVDQFHERFQHHLIQNVAKAFAEVSGVEVWLIIGTQDFFGEKDLWSRYWMGSSKFRTENFEEVAMSAKIEICRLGYSLYWDKKDLTSTFDNTCSQYYPGFLINCCERLEWRWTERDHAAAFGEDVVRDMETMANGLRAYTQVGKKECALHQFRQPCVVRLLKGNSPIASLEAYLERLQKCQSDLDFIKGNNSYDSCVKAVMEVDLAVNVTGTDWLDAGFGLAFDHLEAIEELRCISLEEFWRHQGRPVRAILNTLRDLVMENLNQKRVDPGFCADYEVLKLAVYCEALLCWFVYGRLEPSYGTETGFDVDRLANTLELRPATFSTRSGLYGHYAEPLGFATNAVRIGNGRLELVNE